MIDLDDQMIASLQADQFQFERSFVIRLDRQRNSIQDDSLDAGDSGQAKARKIVVGLETRFAEPSRKREAGGKTMEIENRQIHPFRGCAG